MRPLRSPQGANPCPRCRSLTKATASVGASFWREGEYWTIAYDGAVFRLRDAKGLHCIAHLLGHPGQTVSAVDLLVTGPGAALPALDPAHARVTITKRIRGAIAKIRLHHASLAHHLGTCIQTGTQCVYLPDPRHPRPWRL